MIKMFDLGAASDIGRGTDNAFLFVLTVCVVLLALITLLSVYFVIKYNWKRHPAHQNIEGNAFLEAAWTVIPIIITIFMFNYGLKGYRERIQVPKDALTVRVKARQWLWTFEYENGKESNALNLPLNRPVKFVIDSADVLHGFYIPDFRIKQDAVPGSTKIISATPVREGAYNVFCTQYCGTGHSFMLASAVVMPEDKFNEWLRGRAAVIPAGAAQAAAPAEAASRVRILKGEELYRTRGCSACHSIDGASTVGPSWKGIYGAKVRVVTGGKEREVIVDDEYIRRSELDPNYDVVVGYPGIMPSQKGILTDAEIRALTEYIKSLK